MKKTLLLALTFMAGLTAYGQSAGTPLVINEFYAQKLSPDGKFLYGQTESGEEVIINLETNTYYPFYDIWLGNGNMLALDGTAVGADSETGKAVVIRGANMITQSVLNYYWYSSINGITADCTLAVGCIGNEGSTGDLDDVIQTYLPYIAEVDEDGECGNLTILPHPEEDYSGRVPQYSSATWVSDDGKTVLGQLIDYSGMFIHPIVYRQDEDGKWSYTLPAQSLINPLGIEMPEYPGEFDYSLEPDALAYMTEEMQEEFIEDMETWEIDGYDEDNYPYYNLEYYMTAEKYTEYIAALIVYEDIATKYNEDINNYLESFYDIVDTSEKFLQNGSALNRAGTLAALTSVGYRDIDEYDVETIYGIYLYDIVNDTLSKIESKYTNIIVGQVLEGGIILGSTPTDTYTRAYVYVPGAEDFVPIEEYLQAGNPVAVDWMRENLVHDIMDTDSGIEAYSATRADTTDGTPMITGFGVASEDFSVYAGGVPAYLYSTEVGYLTYVFGDLSSGVRTITAADNAAIKVLGNGVISVDGNLRNLEVVDLSGRAVYSINNAEGIVETNLNRGIYIVTYTDAKGQRFSQKVSF